MTTDRFNVEIKARCKRLDDVRRILVEAGAVSRGIDAQTDTYFAVPSGRLKLREGTIENALIAYTRPDVPLARPCDVALMELSPATAAEVRDILANALPVLRQVVKKREILFIDNVKFHLDRVVGLGSFVEIEALSAGGLPDRPTLEAQAGHWRERLGLAPEDLEAPSYADLLA